jgi:hypothetical protein
MNAGLYPTVAIGTLSGPLPTGVTTAAGPPPGANGAPAFGVVGLSQGDAVEDLTLQPFKTMQIDSAGAALSFSASQLAFLQESFEQQSAAAASGQSNGLPDTTPLGSNG